MSDVLSALSIKDRNGNWIRLPGLIVDDITEAEIAYAVDNWLDEHPEATTTVQDWSLTLNKLVKGTLGFVTPEMYGAVGDGSNNDTQAFEDMLSSGVNSIVLGKNKTYYIRSGLTFSNKEIDLNGSTIKSSTTITLQNDNFIHNGTIYQQGATSFSVPLISVTGNNNIISQISFEGYATGVHYIFVRKDANCTKIESCNFDGKSKIAIHIGGNLTTVTDCIFADNLVPTNYSNCIKLSADNSSDTTTPCGRNTTIKNCIFGLCGDNCVDCFSGALGLNIENCTFNNGASVAIEIKNHTLDPDLDDTSSGYSIEGLRQCKNITVSDCIFLGTGFISSVSATKTENADDYLPVKNITFRNCTAENLDGVPFGVDANVDGLTIDNLMLPGLTTTRYLNCRGKNTIVQNIDSNLLSINFYGAGEVRNCKINQITLASAGVNVLITKIKSYATTVPLLMATYGTCRIEQCDASNNTYLIGLNGAPDLLIVNGNLAKSLMNNGYANAGGKVYLLNNIYTSIVAPETTGIIENVNNFQLT